MSVISKLAMMGAAAPTQPPASFVSYSDSGFIRSGGSSSGSFSVNAPSGMQEGDFLVMVCLTGNAQYNAGGQLNWSVSGFTNFQTHAQSDAGKVEYFYRQVTASETTPYSVSWTFNGGFTPRSCAFILCFRDMSYGGHTGNLKTQTGGVEINYADVTAFSASGKGIAIAAFVNEKNDYPTWTTQVAGLQNTRTINTFDYLAASAHYLAPSDPPSFFPYNGGYTRFVRSGGGGVGANYVGSVVHIYRP